MNSLPLSTNVRADEMWAIILPHLPPARNIGGIAIDLGCGGGDMLWRLHEYDTSMLIYGIDKFVFEETRREAARRGISLRKDDIVRWAALEEEWMPCVSTGPTWYEIAICFSVLGHLKQGARERLVNFMASRSRVSFIEAQYSIEEPYLDMPADDQEFEQWLMRRGFESVTPIGRTHVRIRDAHRTIWKCQ